MSLRSPRTLMSSASSRSACLPILGKSETGGVVGKSFGSHRIRPGPWRAFHYIVAFLTSILKKAAIVVGQKSFRAETGAFGRLLARNKSINMRGNALAKSDPLKSLAPTTYPTSKPKGPNHDCNSPYCRSENQSKSTASGGRY